MGVSGVWPTYYWVSFADAQRGCTVKAFNSVEATEFAQAHSGYKGRHVQSAKPLPYPAWPFINAQPGDCPTFCGHPDQCQHTGRCPIDRRACND